MKSRSKGVPRRSEPAIVHGVTILEIDRNGYEVDRIRVVPRRRTKRSEEKPRGS